MRFLNGRNFVILSDPEHVRSVFTGDPELFLSGRANDNFRHFLGDHTLFILDGDPHKRHRRMLMPPFHGERMRAYGTLMRDLAVQELETWPEGRPFPILDRMHTVTLRIICEAIFGIRDVQEEDRLMALIYRLSSRSPAILAFLGFLRKDLGAWSPWGRFLRARALLDEVLFEEIRSAREKTEEREDVLAKLIEESARIGTPLSDQEVRDELMTLLGAGHETTTSVLGWAFRRILCSPEVHWKVVEEVRSVAADGNISPDDLERLPYLTATIHETMRLHPPIPIAPRYLAQPVTLAGYDLPSATIVCPSPHLAHRDPNQFPEPERFRPERFLNGRPDPFAYFPFGGGARTCIGLSFANYEMRIILAAIFARADLRFAGQPFLQSSRRGIVVTPRDGTPVILERRR